MAEQYLSGTVIDSTEGMNPDAVDYHTTKMDELGFSTYKLKLDNPGKISPTFQGVVLIPHDLTEALKVGDKKTVTIGQSSQGMPYVTSLKKG